MLRSLVALAFGVTANLPLPAFATTTIEGRATVVDGDTIELEGTDERIRLYGIDTPEKGQTCDDKQGRRYVCGPRAAEYLASLIGRNGRVKCFEEDRDRYGRIVAECATRQNLVLNAEMVSAGWAVEYRQYSDGRYGTDEAEAKAAHRGIWQGRFIEPSQWRRGEQLESERGPSPASSTRSAAASVATSRRADCDIKGNISSNGQIYHRPGQRFYARTRIDTTKGERWFCSASEADAAGWRASRQ